ncbi:MAG: UDP-N-acetylmuramate--L-alanine ligase, partial [Actinobacteria bacterium]|nr:UDP-N-acetylmuramate--L-alanine ligase [Actinomycetota bacterium]
REEAVSSGVPALHRSAMLAAICAQAKSIGVAGTHGKTTTTSMLMLILAEAGLRPSFVIGGDVMDMGTGAQWTGGEWLVVEADESDGTHLALPLEATILTNVEADLLDFYDSMEELVAGFDRYLANIAGVKVLCLDDPVCADLARRHESRHDGRRGTRPDVVTYGLSPRADFIACNLRPEHGAYVFDVAHEGTVLGSVSLPLRGIHNVRNATAAIAMAVSVGVPFAVAAASLAKFGGVARRFDLRGGDDGVTFVDDYAHLPAEIAAVLAAARTSGDGWRRVIAVFQPNRFNRMATMSPEYRNAFVDADVVVLTEIYPSGTTPIPGVTAKLVVNAVLDAHPGSTMVWMPRRDDLVDYLARTLRSGDVCISMGCGDISALPDEVQHRRIALRAAVRQ